MDIQQAYLELLASGGNLLDETGAKKVLGKLSQDGYEDCRKDMKEDLEAVVGMLGGKADRKKIANYIEEYLVKEVK